MENEKWISDDQKVGEFDRRTSPEQGDGPTSAEVVTGIFQTETKGFRKNVYWLTSLTFIVTKLIKYITLTLQYMGRLWTE